MNIEAEIRHFVQNEKKKALSKITTAHCVLLCSPFLFFIDIVWASISLLSALFAINLRRWRIEKTTPMPVKWLTMVDSCKRVSDTGYDFLSKALSKKGCVTIREASMFIEIEVAERLSRKKMTNKQIEPRISMVCHYKTYHSKHSLTVIEFIVSKLQLLQDRVRYIARKGRNDA